MHVRADFDRISAWQANGHGSRTAGDNATFSPLFATVHVRCVIPRSRGRFFATALTPSVSGPAFGHSGMIFD
jgi:hypothetical protein